MANDRHGWVCQTAFIRALSRTSDRELLEQFQQQRQTGRYFIALVCRYEQRVSELLQAYVSQSERLADYARYVWYHCFRTWQSWDLTRQRAIDLDEWLQTAVPTALKRLATTSRGGHALPAEISSPLPVPVWCYLMQALEKIPGDLRFILVLSDVFRWTPRQIAQQLSVEGYALAETETEPFVNRARAFVWQMLPSDICSMYVTTEAAAS